MSVRVFNLIPEDVLTHRRARRRVGLWYRVWGTTAVLCIVVGAFSLLKPSASEAALSVDDLVALRSQVATGANVAMAFETKLANLESDLKTQQALIAQPDWGAFVQVISRQASDDVVYSTISATPTRTDPAGVVRGLQIKLAGYGRNQTAISSLIVGLEEMGVFDSVTLITSRREPFGQDEAIAFEIRCHVGEADEEGE